MKNLFLCGLLSFILLGADHAYGQNYYQEISAEAGISHPGFNRSAAVGDYNNDGHDDIFVCRINSSNLLYKNNGDNTFTEVAAELGLDFSGNSNTAVWGDLDNDGWIDLYVTSRAQANLLYHNNGDGTFTEIGETAGVAVKRNPRSVHVVDYDKDGLLDIYVANLGEENNFFKNLGNMTFEEVIFQTNAVDRSIAQAAIFFDYDNDGDQDLYLSHDAYRTNILYRNNDQGYFQNVAKESNTDIEIQSMGVDVADINRDGWLDMYITNLGKNVVLMNNQDGTFRNASTETGLTDVGMGWGNVFLDFDNDGLIDVYTANDSYFSPPPNVLQRNLGKDTFGIVDANTAIASKGGGYGAATLDVNHDGLLDIFVSNTGNDGNQLFLNITSNSGNYLKIKARGTTSNRDAIGTKITLESEGQIFTDEINGGSGFASQNSLTLHFGLGNLENIDKMTVVWPNGNKEVYENLPVNEKLNLFEGEGWFYDSLPLYELLLGPNPMDERQTVSLSIRKPQFIDIQLLDLKAGVVYQLVSEEMPAGVHGFEWKKGNLQAGLYFLKVISDNGVDIRKVVVK
jgi:hypothetical protein